MKKILLSLFVGLIGIISFCSALTINGASSSFSPGTTKTTVKGYCYRINNTSYNIKFYDNNDNYLGNIGSQYNMFCNPADGYVKNEDSITTYLFTYNITNFTGNCSNSDCPVCPTCPEQYTSSQCQSVYGLVSSGLLNTCENNYNNCQTDLNSCQNNTSGFNDLLNNCSSKLNSCNTSLTSCLENNCPVISGDLQLSTLYINDIRHESMPFIYVNIPEEFNWDYSTGINDFTINVEGYNVDTDYISGIIQTQNSKPSQGDLNKLVSEVLPLFIPGLAVILLLYFIFRFIKKIF